MVERSEPSFMPGWLKGSAGSSLTNSQHSQDESVNSRNKVSPLSIGNHSDLPRGLVTSDRVFSPSARRLHHTNSFLERPGPERDNYSVLRSQSGLNRSSSCRNYDLPNWDRDSSAHEYERDVDRDILSRKKEWAFGAISDEREKEREHAENGMQRPLTAGKYDADMKLRRSQSQSPRLSERPLFKGADVISTLPSGPGGLTSSIQKAVFERNFPTLGTDEKQNASIFSTVNSSVASPRPSTGSPRPLWQGTKPDLTRASSPGLAGGFAYSMTMSMSTNSDVWSSALAEVPLPNGNTQVSAVAMNAGSLSSSSQNSISTGSISVTPAAPLNMAEALAQNPPRARTPLQVSIESQRLEELALKQSRQLIPMTPTLPKTMSLADKSKSKTPRAADAVTSKVTQQLTTLQLNKTLAPARPDTPKHTQGKLVVLKSGKDGVMVSTASKSEVVNTSLVTQASSVPSAAVVSSANGVGNSGVVGHRKPEEARPRGSTLLVDDKRPSLQAQNRSDFFNALRKKAAGNGNSTTSSKSNVEGNRDAVLNMEENPANDETNVMKDKASTSSSDVQSNGVLKHDTDNGLIVDKSVESEAGGHSILPRDTEEEEAAFMRSLGWEENAEGGELTEEEINAFYHQLKEREKHLSARDKHRLRALTVGSFVGSVGSVSSGISSSDSETDEEPSYSIRMELSNAVH